MKNSIKRTTVMVTVLLALLVVFGNSELQAQKKSRVLFDDLDKAMMDYKNQGMVIYRKGDEKLAYTYFDDSINNAVIGTYIGDYQFKNVKGKVIDTKELDKPMLLQVTASNCAPCVAEVPALNFVSEKYADQVQIVLLFMDTPEKTQELSKKYNAGIAMVPQFAYENVNVSAFDFQNFAGFKHLLSATPTNYLIAKNKEILGVRKGGVVPRSYVDEKTGKKVVITKEDALEKNIEALEKDIALILKSK